MNPMKMRKMFGATREPHTRLPSPGGGGSTRAKRVSGWGEVSQKGVTPPRLASAMLADPPPPGEGEAERAARAIAHHTGTLRITHDPSRPHRACAVSRAVRRLRGLLVGHARRCDPPGILADPDADVAHHRGAGADGGQLHRAGAMGRRAGRLVLRPGAHRER